MLNAEIWKMLLQFTSICLEPETPSWQMVVQPQQ